jgi:hypothetical protein
MNEQLKKEIDEIITNSLERCEKANGISRLKLLKRGTDDTNDFLKRLSER